MHADMIIACMLPSILAITSFNCCVHLAGWHQHVRHLTARVKADLGVADEVAVQAELYKLLVYEEGDHFTEHRDTEKCPGMFATMTLMLPSQYEVPEGLFCLH